LLGRIFPLLCERKKYFFVVYVTWGYFSIRMICGFLICLVFWRDYKKEEEKKFKMFKINFKIKKLIFKSRK
jgi:hypothetical protein